MATTQLTQNNDILSNVTVTKAANVYFDGKVTSRKITLADNTSQTLGIMMPGSYDFATDKKELMEIMAGEVSVLLPEKDQWQTFVAGEQFYVPANAKFQIKVLTLTDYCCSYLT